MTIRTFKQLARVYGATPVTVTAKIDGVEVFNGTVPALDQPVAIVSNDAPIELFSWTDDIKFQGTKEMEITVDNGTVVLLNTVANYCYTAGTIGPDNFYAFYSYTVDNIKAADPLSNVTINGVPMVREYSPADINNGKTGQYSWVIPGPGVFTATVNVAPGTTGV